MKKSRPLLTGSIHLIGFAEMAGVNPSCPEPTVATPAPAVPKTGLTGAWANKDPAVIDTDIRWDSSVGFQPDTPQAA